jgi:hypothetical protein
MGRTASKVAGQEGRTVGNGDGRREMDISRGGGCSLGRRKSPYGVVLAVSGSGTDFMGCV